MSRNTITVLVWTLVAVCLFADRGQAQVTCNWASATGGYFSTGPWSMNTPVNGGSIDYVLSNTNIADMSMTNDFIASTFLLNGFVASPQGKTYNVYGSNLEFRANTLGALPFINMSLPVTGTGNGLIINQGVKLTTNLTLSGSGASMTGPLVLNGVVSGSGNVTNSRVMSAWYPSLSVTNGNNSFAGNWVNLVANVGVSFPNDGAIGASGNSIILDNGALLVIPTAFTLGSGHSLVIGSGGGKIGRNTGANILTLANENTLTGGGLLTIGQYGSLAVNASQPNFTGQVSVVGTSAALTLGASNALGNAMGMSVGAYGTLALNNPYGAGSSTVTNLANGMVTLGTNLVFSGGTRVYLNDLSVISGSETQLGSLKSPDNVTIPASAHPVVVHPALSDGTGILGVDKTNLVFGSTGNATASRMIGDAVSGQWRGIGAGGADYVYQNTGTLTLNGNAELDATSLKNLYVYGLITGGNPLNTLEFRGGGYVYLNNFADNFTSMIAGKDGTTLYAYTTNTLTYHFAPVNNVFGQINNSTNGTLVLQFASGSSNSFSSINNNSTGTLVLDGAGSTNVTSGKNNWSMISGSTLVFSNGYYYIGWGINKDSWNDANYTLTVAGGNVNFVTPDSSNLRFANTNIVEGKSQINITSGSFTISGVNFQGLKLGASKPDTAGNYNGNIYQSGGVLSQHSGTGTGTGAALDIGGTTSSKTNAYYLSGGLLTLWGGTAGNMGLGAATDSSSLAMLSMTGGKLDGDGKIFGYQGAGARQVFDFSGGTLVAKSVDATRLSSMNAQTSQGTLVNNGGTLAPGDVGRSGTTIIIGNYSNTASTAVMAIDIGGTTASSAYQDAAYGGKFDFVPISGNATLGGNLVVNLIETAAGQVYKPASTSVFKILTNAPTGSSGAFSGANVAGGRVIATDGSTSFLISYNSGNVTLTNALLNEWKGTGAGGTWSTVGGANGWTAMDPNSSLYLATLGTNGYGSLTLDGNRTVQSLAFTNKTQSYTISGANTLTLNNGTNVITVNDYAGNHAVNVPVAVAANLIVNVAQAGDVLTFGATLTQNGSGFTLTKIGAGTLDITGNNTFSGATTVSNGTLKVSASGTLSNSPSIMLVSGATCDVSAVAGYIIPASQTLLGTGTLVGNGAVFNGTINATLLNSVGGPGSVLGPNVSGTVQIGGGATLDLGTSTNYLTGSSGTYTIIPSGVSGSAPSITLPRGWRVSVSGGALTVLPGYAGTMILCQ